MVKRRTVLLGGAATAGALDSILAAGHGRLPDLIVCCDTLLCGTDGWQLAGCSRSWWCILFLCLWGVAAFFRLQPHAGALVPGTNAVYHARTSVQRTFLAVF